MVARPKASGHAAVGPDNSTTNGGSDRDLRPVVANRSLPVN
jgi:hypothetical protein